MRPDMSQYGNARLSHLLEGLTVFDQDLDCDIGALSLDSREVKKGGLFLACAGTQGHGIDYLPQAFAAGVAAVAWEPTAEYRELPEAVSVSVNVPMIAVNDLTQQAGFIADRFYGHPSRDLRVIGITGTNGKTSCCHFLAGALREEGQDVGVIGTLGYGLSATLDTASHTTPDAVRVHELLASMRQQGARYVVMEVSSHGLDQGRVNGVCFEVAVLTNVTRDHLDYHMTVEAYASAKARLFSMPGLQAIILNEDDDYGHRWSQELQSDRKLMTYRKKSGRVSASSMVLEFSNVQLSHDGVQWTASSPWGEASLSSKMFGDFNVYNLAAVLTTLSALGMSWNEACERIKTLTTPPGRMEFYRSHNEQMPLVVIDFAHTPDALEHVLQALKGHEFGRIWCVFGCGGDRDKGKRSLMGGVAESLADQVVITDDNPRTESADAIVRDILEGIKSKDLIHVERDRQQAIAWAVGHARDNDVVLVAGKGHEEYQWIGDVKHPYSDKAVVESLLTGGLH